MAQIQKGTTYSTINSTVTVDNLNAHVDAATLLPGAISEQPSLAGNATPASDQVLLLASGQIKKATVVQALGGVTPSQLLNANNNLSDLASIATAKVNLSLNNVENKSSETIRSEITSSNVTTALGFSPVTPTTSVNAGVGLTGGGPLSASSTISIAALSPSPSGTFGSSAQVPVLTVNNLGQVTSVQTQPITTFTTAQLSAISVSAGAGLTGGGPISSSSTISIAALSPSPAGTFGSSTQLPVLTVNSLGQVTSVTTTPVSSFTTSQLAAISITAGTGLTGGGTIDQSRTLSLAALSPSPVGSYGTSSSIPALTIDAYGRITSASNVGIGVPSVVGYLLENTGVTTTPATGTINFDLQSHPTIFSTVNATAAFTLNIRGSFTTPLNTLMSVNQSLTVSFLYQTGTTAYGLSALQIDGVGQTIRWANGVAPTAIASNINVYAFTIIKTAASTYTVIGSYSRFA